MVRRSSLRFYNSTKPEYLPEKKKKEKKTLNLSVLIW